MQCSPICGEAWTLLRAAQSDLAATSQETRVVIELVLFSDHSNNISHHISRTASRLDLNFSSRPAPFHVDIN